MASNLGTELFQIIFLAYSPLDFYPCIFNLRISSALLQMRLIPLYLLIEVIDRPLTLQRGLLQCDLLRIMAKFEVKKLDVKEGRF